VALTNSWDLLARKLYHDYYPEMQDLTLPHLFLWMIGRKMMMPISDKWPLEGLAANLNETLVSRFVQLDERISASDLARLAELDLTETSMLEALFQNYMDQEMRASTGSYYTPEELAEFMVKQALLSHYQICVSEMAQNTFDLKSVKWREKPSLAVACELKTWFLSLNLLDLSCGSGVFLRQGLKQLISLGVEIHRYDDSPPPLLGMVRELLEERLTGIDTQLESVVLAELLLKVQLARLVNFRPDCLEIIAAFKPGIHCSNALTWEKPDGIEGYQLILGNPPYMGEKGNKNLFHETRQTVFGRRVYEKNMDFSYFFLHRGLDLLAPRGVLCYVTTSYFATADGAAKLRNRLKQETSFHWLVYPENVTLFPQAKGQHNLIYCLGNRKHSQSLQPKLLHLTASMEREDFLQRLLMEGIMKFGDGAVLSIFHSSADLYDQRGQMLIRTPGKNRDFLKKMEEQTPFHLQDLCTINQGLVSGADKVALRHSRLLGEYCNEPGRGIFVLNQSEKEMLIREDPTLETKLKPFYKNSQIWPYRTALETDQWILYLTDTNTPEIDMNPALKNHLTPYRSVLEMRREVQMGVRRWHSLHWPRNADIFEKPKIVSPQRAGLNVFALSEEPWYASADVYYLQRRATCFYSMEYLLAWLNSALCYAWLSYYGKMKGKDLELYATPLKSIPVPVPPDEIQEGWMMDQVKWIQKQPISSDAVKLRQREIDQRFMAWMGMDDIHGEELLNQVDRLRKKFSRREG